MWKYHLYTLLFRNLFIYNTFRLDDIWGVLIMAKKTSKRSIPRKKVKRSNKKKEKELKKKAIKIIKRRQLVNIGLSLILIFLILSTTLMLYLNSVHIKISETTSYPIKKLVEINNFLFPKPPELD